MPHKIFISYRREDAGANALGISQYLEKELGRKNVFIDVDMRAGAKFPVVLEQRLAECKVLLALIGPEWLNARDEHGQRRIDLPDDWVRLEIAQALKRDITVIPVRVNGAMLPSRENLPEDIRGLVDHQAVSITLAGFRHEMSGLVRDIRAIPSSRPWRRFSVIAAGFVCLLAALAAIWALRPLNLFDAFRGFFPQPTKTVPQPTKTVSESGEIWRASPGEWILFGADTQPGVGYYFEPSASKKFGDRAVLTVRYPFKPADAPGTGPLGAYQDGRVVFDCKNNNFASAETTIYNKAGEIISHIKEGEPEALNPSAFKPMPPGSLLSAAMQIACNESLATSLGDQVKRTKLTYLFGLQNPDGDLFYGPWKKSSQSPYQIELLVVGKFFQDHSLADLFATKPVLNYPYTYRSNAGVHRFNCMDRKAKGSKIDDFDALGNLVFIDTRVGEFDVQEGTALSAIKSRICSAAAVNVAGTYEGMNYIAYKTAAQGEQRFFITIKQDGVDLKATYRTGGGGQGEGVGTLVGAEVTSMSWQSTTPGCPGSYDASLEFAEDSVTWSFKGEDCGGQMEGHGTAKKVKT
jgi:hypothetical protein